MFKATLASPEWPGVLLIPYRSQEKSNPGHMTCLTTKVMVVPKLVSY